MKIPIVLPVVGVDIDGAGALSVDVDGVPYGAGRTLCRDDLRSVLDEITAEHQSAVRVEVHEDDGTSYADIATPPADPPVGPSGSGTDATPAFGHPMPGASGQGFRPGEQVAVAVVLLHRIADDTGSAVVNLPPSVMSGRGASVVMFGLDSHVMTRVEACREASA